MSDDPDSWPSPITLSGFTYNRFQRSGGTDDDRLWDVDARLRWLRRMPSYEPGPYERLARVFREHGLMARSDEILMASQRDSLTAERALSRHTGRAARLRTALRLAARRSLGPMVGYGYRPGRALAALAVLVCLVSGSLLMPVNQHLMRANDGNGAIFTVTGPILPAKAPAPTSNRPPTPSASTSVSEPCGNGAVPCFNALYYAVDTVIPLVSLKQRDAWYPETSGQAGQILLAWLNLATVVGWLLSSVFVFAFTKIVRTSL